jgi:hypothetical protein
MHSGNPDTSRRLARTLEILKSHPRGVTTAELQAWTGSMAPATDCSELRQSGYRIGCLYEGTSQNGRRVYRYTLDGMSK